MLEIARTPYCGSFEKKKQFLNLGVNIKRKKDK
jgi:hypothetical protein